MKPGPFDLTLTRRLKASRKAVWRCWTEPDLLVKWFCPPPWRLAEAKVELRTGGGFYTLMQGPEAGDTHEEEGAYLEVVPMERLVFTNALGAGWRPNDLPEMMPLMTIILEFRDAPDNGTIYSVLVLHKNAAGRDAHATMGFEAGWGIATNQLDALAQTL